MPRAAQRPLTIGDRILDFTLPDQHGNSVRLHDLLGENTLVIYFYPKDETRGCTAEACAFRDSYGVFQEAGAMVIGISGDSVGSHYAFAQRHRLPFTLLSDRGNVVRKLWGVPATLGVVPGRTTYVVDSTGTIRHVFNSQLAPTRHVQEALAIIRHLQRDIGR